MNKKNRLGQEISINTLVAVILGIVIVSGGVLIFKNIFDKGSELPKQIDSQTEQLLINNLRSGEEKVVAIPQTRTIERKEQARYALGIINQLEAESTEFRIAGMEMTVTNSCNNQNNECPQPIYLDTPITLDRYEIYTAYVGIKTNGKTKPGKYAFRIKIEYNDDGTWKEYDSKKIYLSIK